MFKKGDKSQVSNYRPVSLLTGFLKIFELLTFHKLKHKLVSINILANEQFGFCDTGSIEVLLLNSSSRFSVHGIII